MFRSNHDTCRRGPPTHSPLHSTPHPTPPHPTPPHSTPLHSTPLILHHSTHSKVHSTPSTAILLHSTLILLPITLILLPFYFISTTLHYTLRFSCSIEFLIMTLLYWLYLRTAMVWSISETICSAMSASSLFFTPFAVTRKLKSTYISISSSISCMHFLEQDALFNFRGTAKGVKNSELVLIAEQIVCQYSKVMIRNSILQLNLKAFSTKLNIV